MTKPMLIALGGAHVDRRGKVAGRYIPGASNPGAMREEIGGGAFNALRNAVQRGVAGSLVSLRGGDSAGESVALAVEAAAIKDLSATFLDRATPSYTAFIDSGGDVIAGLADTALYELFPKQVMRRHIRDAIQSADAILADANLPAAALVRVASLAMGKPFFAIAISPAKVIRFAAALPALSLLFMNRREATTLCEAPADAPSPTLVQKLRERGLNSGVITAGDAAIIAFQSDSLFSLQPPRLHRTSDATGAGDALAGATIAAIMRGLPLRAALREGAAAATATVTEQTAVARLEERRFREILAGIPECEIADLSLR
ncbi:MAG TPA: carbohydrate kinase family protein [Rhizobiaceae bacterium]|nr:carbohydrate kinase family protein [Rhizobiaceae bacterium]